MTSPAELESLAVGIAKEAGALARTRRAEGVAIAATKSNLADIVTEADREATAVMFPQGRWGEPDDAARLITWLLTDEARWITGQVINSEGGFARWRR